MTINVGFSDRIIRMLMATLIVGLLTNQMVISTTAIISAGIVAILILTSVLGICPLYTLLGIDTTPKN